MSHVGSVVCVQLSVKQLHRSLSNQWLCLLSRQVVQRASAEVSLPKAEHHLALALQHLDHYVVALWRAHILRSKRRLCEAMGTHMCILLWSPLSSMHALTSVKSWPTPASLLM